MSFLRTLLLASALAISFTATHAVMTEITAEAAQKGKKAKKAKTAMAYKSCGTYMYRKGGKCMDARAKK